MLMHLHAAPALDTLHCKLMNYKIVAVSILLLFTWPAIAQTSGVQPAAPDRAAHLKIGGDVLPPMLIYSVKPKSHRSLFHAPKSNTVLVGLTVPPDGVPINVHIVHSGGDQLDNASLRRSGNIASAPPL